MASPTTRDRSNPGRSVFLPERCGWYAIARSEAVHGAPVSAQLGGYPVVIFRDGTGRPSVLEDRCPHRNVPLSIGRVEAGDLRCAYHGWRFDAAGRCVEVPCRADEAPPKAQARAFAALERDGLIWAYANGEEAGEPEGEPFAIPTARDPRYRVVTHEVDLAGDLHAVAENALDVPHTGFVHGGLFREAGAASNEVRVLVRRTGGMVEAEYVGEPAPRGLMGRVLSPGGGTVHHVDRFALPGIAQVEYRLGDHTHLVATTALNPIGPRRTRMFAVVTARLPGALRLVVPVVTRLGLAVLAQDAKILRAQSQTVERFGGPDYASTTVDVLGPHIARLLRHGPADDIPHSRVLTLFT